MLLYEENEASAFVYLQSKVLAAFYKLVSC